MSSSNEIVAVVGSGLVGMSWAMIFASAGNKVRLYDAEEGKSRKAAAEITKMLTDLEREDSLRGSLTAAAQAQLVTPVQSLKEALEGVSYVQESVPEVLSIKKQTWAKVDALLPKDAKNKVILATSSSGILPRFISEELKNRENFIVAHPVNPPYFAPMVELVPAPWTSDWTRKTARHIMNRIGQVPVNLNKEKDGFVLNRIQYAILGECWRLVSEGVVTAEDMDVVMSQGLGLRYAFCGPLEVIHLNAPDGTQDYMDRYGEAMTRVSSDSGPIPESWLQKTPKDREEVNRISSEMSRLYPAGSLDARRQRRDRGLAELAKLKRRLNL